MKYERLTKRDKNGDCHLWDDTVMGMFNALDCLAELEDKIESGEIDYVSDKDKEIAKLHESLKNSIMLPYIEKRKDYTIIICKKQKGGIVSVRYFHNCYYGAEYVRGDKFAESYLEDIIAMLEKEE